MKIALINENSQAAKNELVCNTLKSVVEPLGRVFDRRSIVFKFILRSLYTMYIIPLFFLSNV